GLQRLGADRGHERREQLAVLAPRCPRPELVAEEREAGVLVLAPTVVVFAIDDPRFLRVKPEPQLLKPLGDRGKHILGLPPALAMHDRIVGITLKRARRELPAHP